MPPLSKVSEYGRFPETFGPSGDRFPVAAELVTFEESDYDYHCGQRASAGRPDEAAAYVIEALTETLETGSVPLERRARMPAGYLAGELTEWACEHLLRVHVAAGRAGRADRLGHDAAQRVPLDEQQRRGPLRGVRRAPRVHRRRFPHVER